MSFPPTSGAAGDTSPRKREALELFSGLPRRYDALAEVLSFAQNARWRRELVERIAVHRPSSILDVATGTAGVAIALASATDARITGVDISHEMLERGRQRVAKAGLVDRVTLQPARAESVPFPPQSFDAVTFTYLLRYVADPAATVAELARVLRPGGHMASLDFYVPPSLGWRASWRAYTRTLLPLGGLALGGRSWWDVGRFLGPNIESFYKRWPAARIVGAWKAARMVDVGWRVMSLGGGLVMWGTKPSV
jgi:demethylmenaquinone methyltransferase/2-methoxy-6-polyprenyl-1,4-benzoquinol methylase